MSHELTICSVSYKSGAYLELNREITRTLNPESPHRWLIAENTPEDLPYRLELSSDPRFTVIQGPEPIERPKALKATASYHHASALNLLISQVNTRYALVLDPDFFVVRPQWIQQVLSHMQTQNLAFFGAPWFPLYLTKYRYFPCVHCMFIDLEKVDKAQLDFNPAIEEFQAPDIQTFYSRKGVRRRMALHLQLIIRAYTRNKKQRVESLMYNRRSVGASPDTGYRIYKDFHGKPDYLSECVQGAFDPMQDSNHWKKAFNRWIERQLPEELTYLPKDTRYYSTQHFRDLGYPDLHGHGWDEFIWQGEPFGFHIRNYLRTTKFNATLEEQIALIQEALPHFSSKLDLNAVSPLGARIG